jgi:hypothetical protein
MRPLLLAAGIALAAALPSPAIAADRAAGPSLTPGSSLAERAAPVAGRFCKTADRNKKRRDSKGRTVRCQKKGGHHRWVVIAR